jgi:hypothetical protein
MCRYSLGGIERFLDVFGYLDGRSVVMALSDDLEAMKKLSRVNYHDGSNFSRHS